MAEYLPVIKSQTFFGSARTGIIQLNDQEISFPALIEPGIFNFADGTFKLFNEKFEPRTEELRGRQLNIFESENFFVPSVDPSIILRSKRMTSAIMELKSKLGYEKLLYVPGISDPYIVPQLYLLGMDIFDTIQASMEGQKGIEYSMMGRLHTQSNSVESNKGFLREILKLLSLGTSGLTLMELVERWNISPKGNEVVRRIYSDFYGDFEKSYPRFANSVLASSTISSGRPEIQRFNSYITGEYRKPSEPSIALFIPCSARKPYSTSKSHIALSNALGSLKKNVHEIILTSPLSIVPRELEEVYPAGFYDISVIGEWYEDEKKALKVSIDEFLANNSYKEKIFFLHKDMEFIEETLPKGARFIEWKRNVPDPFEELLKVLRELAMQQAVKRDFAKEKLKAMAIYQFGSWIKPYLEELKVTRMFNQLMLTGTGGNPFFIFNPELGKMTIHRNAANLFLDNNRYLIEIDDFKPTANIYAMGIKNCSKDIRQEDEIVIHHGGEIRGTGISKMSWEIMIKSRKGIAVKVRG